MAKVQKVYTREFKEQAVQLAQTSGKPITPVARELGISELSGKERSMIRLKRQLLCSGNDQYEEGND